MEGNRSSIFDVAMLQNYCVRPNLDGSISTISNVAIPLILHVGSPHSYNQWQCYIPEIVDCMLYQVVGPPIYAQISPVSHTFVMSECILYIYIILIYIYIDRFIFGRVIFWLHIHAQVLVEKSWPRRDLRFLFLRPGFTMSKAQWWFEWVMSNGKR